MRLLLVLLLSAAVTIVPARLCAEGPSVSAEAPKEVSEFSKPEEALEHFLDRTQTKKIAVPAHKLVQRFGEKAIIQHLESILDATQGGDRRAVASTLVEVASDSDDSATRQRILGRFLHSGLTNETYRMDLDWVDAFKGSDFDGSAKKLLLGELSGKYASVDTVGLDERIVLWSGKAGLREAIPILNEIDRTQRKGEYKSANPFYQRSALLALARLGERPFIEEAIRLVDEMSDKEDRAVFIRELAYIHQPEVVEYLKQYLFSDIVYETASLDVVPVAESWYASRALGSMLKGFPKGTIDEQRNWIRGKAEYEFDS